MKNIENIIHNFGLDHLEIFGTFKDESIFDALDFDNSNYAELDDYKVIKTEVYKYQYKIIFTKENYSFFAYYKGIPKGEKQPVATKDYIVVYSTAFKFLEYEEVAGFLQYYLELSHPRRFDICIDLRINIDELLNKHFEDYKTGREYKKGAKIETRYYGEVQNSLNKRQLIRVYNKKLDILVKNKIELYQNYLVEKDITRVELEIRPELARQMGYYDIFDNSVLFRIFKNYIRKYSNIFEKIEGEKISLYKARDVKLDPESYQSLFYREKRRDLFLGHAKTVYNVGFCPVRVLIQEGYIHDRTALILGLDNIEDIRVKEKKAIEQAKENKYIRNNLDKILNDLYKYGKV